MLNFFITFCSIFPGKWCYYRCMNILFYLTPKCECAYLEDTDSIRQALEKMEARRYTAIPLLNSKGEYLGTISEGDLLWNIKNRFDLDLHKAEHVRITEPQERHMPFFLWLSMCIFPVCIFMILGSKGILRWLIPDCFVTALSQAANTFRSCL